MPIIPACTLRLRDNSDVNANWKRSISQEVLNLHVRDVVTSGKGLENAWFGVVDMRTAARLFASF